jgi:hypothetical protein
MTRPFVIREGSRALTPDQVRLREDVEKARGRRMTALPLVTCDPHSEDKGGRLENHLRHIGVELKDLADAAEVDGKAFNYVVGLTDKSQQNPINKLGGKAASDTEKSCGDVSMDAYFDTTGNAMWNMSVINGSEGKGLHMTRMGRRSDEGVVCVGGMTRIESVDDQFRMSWDVEKENLDLRKYTYTVRAGGAPFESDLLAFSKVLRYEGIVVACDCKMSAAKVVNTNGKPDFILEELRKLENSGVEFYDSIPPFYKGNGGMAEVRTPFKNSLTSRGQEKTEQGCFIEIKFEIPEENAKAYLEKTKDVRTPNGELVERGTRKGYSELFHRVGGMRMLNTFGSKARANLMLSGVAHAMGDIVADCSLDVVPVSGGFLQYWIDKPISEELRRNIQRKLDERFSSEVAGDPTFVKSYLKPAFGMIDARSMKIEDVRAAFILDSLGMGNWPLELLDRADFLVNFLEHIDPVIKREIYDSLARHENGGRPVKMSDLKMMDQVSMICQHRRTIRDTEDLIWTLRMDPELPDEVSKERKEIEKWYFDFAWERFDKIFYMLTRKIDGIRNNDYKKN